MISRLIENQVVKALKPGRVVGIFGPRRSGKTTLLSQIQQHAKLHPLVLHGDNLDAQELLSSQRVSVLKPLLTPHTHLFIDEAQLIPRIWSNLKLIVDHLPHLQILVTGSSSFDLRQQLGEPLVGRALYYYLYPFALQEIETDPFQNITQLPTHLIYGMYPQIVTCPDLTEKQRLLEQIRDGYLLKDILMLDNLKDSVFILNLLRQIAFQIGHDVSYAELACNLSVNKQTVMRYLDLLEKCYILFSHPGFSRNLRKEYSKSPRYYFYDNGIRNAVIAAFNRLELRNDVSQLFENFFIAERVKWLNNHGISANRFFWRTYQQEEIDLIEERQGQLFGFECAWSYCKHKLPKSFSRTYPEADVNLVTKENYYSFLQ